jgi:hypothetical protein
LAAYIKDLGKKAVHLGGTTQIMFGIRGKRWDLFLEEERKSGASNGFYSNLFNEHWVYPSPSETPARSELAESGCYW